MRDEREGKQMAQDNADAQALKVAKTLKNAETGNTSRAGKD